MNATVRRSDKKTLRVLCPNGHMGFAPTKEESFYIGAETCPDFYCCDSGSDDIGPGALGADTSVSPYAWQRHDLELMLLAARRQGVPMLVGSAGDTGADSRVDLYVKTILELAQEHHLPPFKLGYFYSNVDKASLRAKLLDGMTFEGLDGRENLTLAELDRTNHVVAVAGVHPYIELLKRGADVIIGGRSSDCAIFAAPAIQSGFPESLAYYLGKVLECASFCAEPYAGKETVIGTITHDDVKVTAMHPSQRCTVASVAGHAMYERSNPFYEYFAGGHLDMRECRYEQFDEKTCRITGPRFVPIQGPVKVKLEGAAWAGERCVGIVGVRDPYVIRHIDQAIAWARQHVEQRFAGRNYQLHYRVYGRNGVMGDLEPLRNTQPHEVCLVVQGVASTRAMAEEVTLIGTRQLFYARLPEVQGTAGLAAYVLDEVLPATPAYEWTLNHVMPVADPMELFPVHTVMVGTNEPATVGVAAGGAR